MSVSRYVTLAVSMVLLAGCQSYSTQNKQPAPTTQPSGTKSHEAMHTTDGAQSSVAKPVQAAPKAQGKAIRIDAGATGPLTDKSGNQWLADTGFADGEIVDRGDVPISGTDNPRLFQTEHFGMTAFSMPVPNGKYTVKLYFAETYDGITAAGERVFSANVEGKEIKDIDPFKDGGGLNKASMKTAEAQVTDGKLDIKFTEQVQSPEVNAIEIIPQ